MLVFDGREVPIPGVESSSFLEDKRLGFTDPRDYSERETRWIRNICIHTRMGLWPQQITDVPQNRQWDKKVANRHSGDSRHASWHISIDSDGSCVCHLDILNVKAYHAGQINEYSVGIEIFQDTKGVIAQAALDTCVKVVDVLTRELGIQRQFVEEKRISKRFARARRGWRKSSRLSYVPGGEEGRRYVGVLGHRNATRNRGRGDPGDYIFEELETAGYEKYRVNEYADLEMWKRRQKSVLGFSGGHIDGLAGPKTVRALKEKGYKHGLFVCRPGD